MRKVLIDSGNLKKSNDENLDDEYVFYKSTNSLLQFNNNKNRSTKFSAHRSNKQNNNNNNNQTKLKMNRKQHLENIIGQSTSTVSFNMYELEYNSCNLIFQRSKFHYIITLSVVFILFFIRNNN